MATAEELLAGVAAVDKTLIISNDLRTISVPSSVTNLGVESDDEVLRLNFKMPRYIGDIDLSTFGIRINYLNSQGESDIYTVNDAAISNDNIEFSWLVGPTATRYKGDTKFNVCLIKLASDSEYVDKEYNTTVASLKVLEGLEVDRALVEQYSDILEQWRRELFGTGESAITELSNLLDYATGDLHRTGDGLRDQIERKGAEVLAAIPEDYVTVVSAAGDAMRSKAVAIASSAQGESIILSDGAADPLRGLKVFGKTSQYTTTGKNLLDLDSWDVLTKQADGSYKSNVKIPTSEKLPVVLPAAIYHVSGYIKCPVDTNYRFAVTYADGTKQSQFVYSTGGWVQCEFTTNGKAVESFSLDYSGSSTQLYIKNVQIELGSIATEYEPYSGGAPSPNPDYPQELKSIENPIIAVHGKNFFDPNTCEILSNSGEVSPTLGSATVYGDDIILTKTSETPFIYGQFLSVQKGETYSLSFVGGKNSTGEKHAVYVVADYPGTVRAFDTVITIVSSDTEVSQSFVATSDRIFVGVYSGTSTPVSEKVAYSNVQLELGDTTTYYERGSEEQTLIPERALHGFPVSSGGNYTDSNSQQWISDEIDYERGVLIQRIGEFALTGAENWSALASADGYHTYLCSAGERFYGDLTHCVGMNSHFYQRTAEVHGTYEYLYLQNTASGGNIFIQSAKFATVSELTTWLSSNNVTVLYILATPVEIPLSSDELSAYKTLHANTPYTVISNNMDATMEAKYNVDTEKWIRRNVVQSKRYATIQDAIAEINESDDGAVIAYTSGDAYEVRLFDDISVTERIDITRDCTLCLNGHVLSFGPGAYLNILGAGVSVTIDGSANGSGMYKNNVAGTPAVGEYLVFAGEFSNVNVVGGKYVMQDISNADHTIAIVSREGSRLHMRDCAIDVSIPTVPPFACSVSGDEFVAEDCVINITSDKIVTGIMTGTTGVTRLTNVKLNGETTGVSDSHYIYGVRAVTTIKPDMSSAAPEYILDNCDINVAAPERTVKVYGVISSCYNPSNVKSYDKPKLVVKNCHIEADGYSDTDMDGDGEYTYGEGVVGVYAIGSPSSTDLFIDGGYYWGGRDGISVGGNARIDGGVYGGPQHGGAYLSGGNVFVRNAVFCGTNPKKYFDPTMNQHHGCVYCGSSTKEAKVYFDNCRFVATNTSAWSVFNGVAAKYNKGTKVYLSNCEFVESICKIGNHLRADTGVTIYVGKNVKYTRVASPSPDSDVGHGTIDTTTYKDREFGFDSDEYAAVFGDYDDITVEKELNDWHEIAAFGINAAKLDTRVKALEASSESSSGAVPVDGVVKEVTNATFKVGEDLLSSANITLGNGWSGNLVDGFTHTAGTTDKPNIEPLIFDIGASNGDRFFIEAELDKNVSAVSLSVGGSHPTDPYGSNPFVWGVQCVDDGSDTASCLKITPINTWSGKIFNLQCQKATNDGQYTQEITLDNIAHDKMSNHLSGFWDIQIGLNALKSSINTTRCIAIGKESLCHLQSGGRNIGLGTFTWPYMKYGENNIGIGADSGMYVEEAHDCIAIGKAALSYGKNVKDNVAIGAYALNGAGDSEIEGNVAIGKNAGYKCKTVGTSSAKNNVLIGNQAGYHIETGVNNTLIGPNTMGTSSGSMNTGIGANVSYADGISCSTAIGYQATTTKSNQVVLGKYSGGWGDTTETLVHGNLVVRATDGTKKQIVFNPDGTIGWTAVE